MATQEESGQLNPSPGGADRAAAPGPDLADSYGRLIQGLQAANKGAAAATAAVGAVAPPTSPLPSSVLPQTTAKVTAATSGAQAPITISDNPCTSHRSSRRPAGGIQLDRLRDLTRLLAADSSDGSKEVPSLLEVPSACSTRSQGGLQPSQGGRKPTLQPEAAKAQTRNQGGQQPTQQHEAAKAKALVRPVTEVGVVVASKRRRMGAEERLMEMPIKRVRLGDSAPASRTTGGSAGDGGGAGADTLPRGSIKRVAAAAAAVEAVASRGRPLPAPGSGAADLNQRGMTKGGAAAMAVVTLRGKPLPAMANSSGVKRSAAVMARWLNTPSPRTHRAAAGLQAGSTAGNTIHSTAGGTVPQGMLTGGGDGDDDDVVCLMEPPSTPRVGILAAPGVTPMSPGTPTVSPPTFLAPSVAVLTSPSGDVPTSPLAGGRPLRHGVLRAAGISASAAGSKGGSGQRAEGSNAHTAVGIAAVETLNAPARPTRRPRPEAPPQPRQGLPPPPPLVPQPEPLFPAARDHSVDKAVALPVMPSRLLRSSKASHLSDTELVAVLPEATPSRAKGRFRVRTGSAASLAAAAGVTAGTGAAPLTDAAPLTAVTAAVQPGARGEAKRTRRRGTVAELSAAPIGMTLQPDTCLDPKSTEAPNRCPAAAAIKGLDAPISSPPAAGPSMQSAQQPCPPAAAGDFPMLVEQFDDSSTVGGGLQRASQPDPSATEKVAGCSPQEAAPLAAEAVERVLQIIRVRGSAADNKSGKADHPSHPDTLAFLYAVSRGKPSFACNRTPRILRPTPRPRPGTSRAEPCRCASLCRFLTGPEVAAPFLVRGMAALYGSSVPPSLLPSANHSAPEPCAFLPFLPWPMARPHGDHSPAEPCAFLPLLPWPLARPHGDQAAVPRAVRAAAPRQEPAPSGCGCLRGPHTGPVSRHGSSAAAAGQQGGRGSGGEGGGAR